MKWGNEGDTPEMLAYHKLNLSHRRIVGLLIINTILGFVNGTTGPRIQAVKGTETHLDPEWG